MEEPLAFLEEGLLKSISWVQATDLEFIIETDTQRLFKLTFKAVSFFKVLASRVPTKFIDNEIWKLEEIPNSPLVAQVHSQDGGYWLSQSFGTQYKRSTGVPDEKLRHFVLLSDYLDLELLCQEYNLHPTD